MIGPKSNGTMASAFPMDMLVGRTNCLWLPKDMLMAGQVSFGGWPTKGQWFFNDMLARKLRWLAGQRPALCEGHVGGWPNSGLVGV